MTEAQLQIAVFEYLKAVLIPPAFAFHVPNEAAGKRSKWATYQLKRQGLVPGAPDLLILFDGRCVGIELKTPSGRVSRAQDDFLRAMNAAGCSASVCRSIDDVKQFLKLLGIKTRERAHG